MTTPDPGSQPSRFEVRLCEPFQRDALRDLLSQCGLPAAGLDDHWGSTWVATRAGESNEVVGSVALEMYGVTALLRSLAARADHRGFGLGNHLFEFTLARAKEAGVETLAILTTTAETFFARRGFRVVSREELPAALQASAELRGACPASARAMIRRLG